LDVQQLDITIRVAGLTLLLLLAVMLIRDQRGRRLAASFAPLALCLSGFLIDNTPDPSLRVHGFIAAAHLASGYAVVFLWWFCLASFDPTFRPRGAVWPPASPGWSSPAPTAGCSDRNSRIIGFPGCWWPSALA